MSLLADAAEMYRLDAERQQDESANLPLDTWVEKTAGRAAGQDWPVGGDAAQHGVIEAVAVIASLSGWAFGSVIPSDYYRPNAFGLPYRRSLVVMKLLKSSRKLGLVRTESAMRALEWTAWVAGGSGGVARVDEIKGLTASFTDVGLDSPLDLAQLADDVDADRPLGTYSVARMERLGRVVALLGGLDDARRLLEEARQGGRFPALAREVAGSWATGAGSSAGTLGELLDELEDLPLWSQRLPPSYRDVIAARGRAIGKAPAGETEDRKLEDYERVPPPSYRGRDEEDKQDKEDEATAAWLEAEWSAAHTAISERRRSGAETTDAPSQELIGLMRNAKQAQVDYVTFMANRLLRSWGLPAVTADQVRAQAYGRDSGNERALALLIALSQRYTRRLQLA
jgi:hypothetical protein